MYKEKVDLVQDQIVVDRIQDIVVDHHVQDIMIEDLHIVLDQDEIDRHYHVIHIPESIRAKEIVLPVQTN